jgi:hypothetical protein
MTASADEIAAKEQRRRWYDLVSGVLPILAVVSYGIGRLLVDGFYGRLNTTGEAAGLGYATIIEPAAIIFAAILGLVASVALLVTIIEWTIHHWHKIIVRVVVVGIEAVAPLILVVLYILRNNANAVLLAGAAATGASVAALGSIAVGVKPPSHTRPTGTKWVLNSMDWMKKEERKPTIVVLSLAILVGVGFGAHDFGYHEGTWATKGHTVRVSIIGFRIPSISATPVYIDALAPSRRADSLLKSRCQMQIGQTGSSLLVYNVDRRIIESIPLSQVVVQQDASASTSCNIAPHTH